MVDLFAGWLATLGGLLVFGAAYYIHQKVRLTRFACVLAVVAGFMTYNSAIGGYLNRYAAQVAIFTFCAVIIGIAVIVADIKGKRKGADRPALFAFFLVPIFFVAFLASLPTVADQFGDGVQQTGTGVQRMGR
jgi:peptidoglycan/LPS O-acetylase OafA/YrhL